MKSRSWILAACLAIVLAPWALAEDSALSKPSGVVTNRQASTTIDHDAERQLFDKANQERAKAGLPPLRMDEGLAQAARDHAAALATEQQLSHQFPGEPPLAQRLAGSSNLHLDHGGENVASAPSVEQVHESLMLSPPHRQNLLNASYNVAGFGVVRSGHTLFVTQDFGQGSQTYSRQEAKERLIRSLQGLRANSNLPALESLENDSLSEAACSLAQADSLKGPLPRTMTQARYLLRYTTSSPEALAPSVPRIANDEKLRMFAASSCYARTASYPNGMYWVVLAFY